MSQISQQPTVSENNHDLGQLFGKSDRRKTELRDDYRDDLISVGVNSALLQDWPIDEWEAGEDFAETLRRGGQLGVEFLNNRISLTQKITKAFSEGLVTSFNAHLSATNPDASQITPINIDASANSGFQNFVQGVPNFLEEFFSTANNFNDMFGNNDGGQGGYTPPPQNAGSDIPWTKLAIAAGATAVIGIGISKMGD